MIITKGLRLGQGEYVDSRHADLPDTYENFPLSAVWTPDTNGVFNRHSKPLEAHLDTSTHRRNAFQGRLEGAPVRYTVVNGDRFAGAEMAGSFSLMVAQDRRGTKGIVTRQLIKPGEFGERFAEGSLLDNLDPQVAKIEGDDFPFEKDELVVSGVSLTLSSMALVNAERDFFRAELTARTSGDDMNAGFAAYDAFGVYRSAHADYQLRAAHYQDQLGIAGNN